MLFTEVNYTFYCADLAAVNDDGYNAIHCACAVKVDTSDLSSFIESLLDRKRYLSMCCVHVGA